MSIRSKLVEWDVLKAPDRKAGDDVVAIQPATATSAVTPMAPQVPSGVNVDAKMADQLKAQVLGVAPLVAKFMTCLDTARQTFGNDDMPTVKAAFAFTGASKASLIGELERTVPAALAQAEKGLEQKRDEVRRDAVGQIESDLAAANTAATQMDTQVQALQQQAAQKRSEAAALSARIRGVEEDLKRQDATVNATFAQVKQVFASLQQTLARI